MRGSAVSALGLLVLVVMIWGCRGALVSDSGIQHSEPFCVHSSSALGRTQASFLRRDPGSASLQLYRAVWGAGRRVEECWISTEADVIQQYRTVCGEERAWGSPPDLSQLLQPGGPCQLHRRPADLSSEAVAKTRRRRAWVFPGTLWCGRGSSAGEYEQLGMFEGADRCCREHDHCSHIIRPFTVNFGVFNPTFFTISHCDCDHRFKQCLLNVNDSVSNMVGYTFFHILKLRCFDLVKKKRCTQLNWFGMCTSVQDAPFAILKNPIPYNVSSSDPESSGISKSSANEMFPSAKRRTNNRKPQRRRKQSKVQRSNDPVPEADALLTREKMQKRYLHTIRNSTCFHRKNRTIINHEAVCKTKHMHQITESLEPAKNMDTHKVLSQEREFSSSSLKNIHTKKKKATAIQSKMLQSHEPLMSKQNYDSVASSVDHNVQSTQQINALKRQSLAATQSPVLLTSMSSMFPIPNTKKIPKKRANLLRSNISTNNSFSSKTSGITFASTSIPSAKISMLPKQKFKASNSENNSTNVTHSHKRRKPTQAKPSPSTRPSSTRWKDIVLSPKTSLLVSVSHSWENVKLKNDLSSKQETISSNMKNIDGKKSRKQRRLFSLMRKVTTTPTSKNPRNKFTSLLKQKVLSLTKTKETPSSPLQNKTSSMCEGKPCFSHPCRSTVENSDCLKGRSEKMKEAPTPPLKRTYFSSLFAALSQLF